MVGTRLMLFVSCLGDLWFLFVPVDVVVDCFVDLVWASSCSVCLRVWVVGRARCWIAYWLCCCLFRFVSLFCGVSWFAVVCVIVVLYC